MTGHELRQQIQSLFNTSRDFVAAFNKAAGFGALDETTLSRQLSGRVSLSRGWIAAYTFFFQAMN
jgi:hypothetical protein